MGNSIVQLEQFIAKANQLLPTLPKGAQKMQLLVKVRQAEEAVNRHNARSR